MRRKNSADVLAVRDMALFSSRGLSSENVPFPELALLEAW